MFRRCDEGPGQLARRAPAACLEVVGDDWRIAAGIILALGATTDVAHNTAFTT